MVFGAGVRGEAKLVDREAVMDQLWRCRDVRYRQNLMDRILGIAQVEVFAQNSTTPHLEISGMPASRQRLSSCAIRSRSSGTPKNV